MLSDTAALALAWLAFRWTHRPSDRHRTYGYDRLQILAAFTNGIALVVLALWIVIEAVGRLLEPTPVMGGIMITIAAAGLAVNVVAFLILREGAADNLNLRGALAHVLGDLLGSLAALAAGAVIILTGWTPIDPLLSVLVAGLILRSAVDLVRRSGHILMEGTPEGLDPNELAVFLQREIPDVLNVHHVHAWSLTNERPMVTLQADVTLDADVNLVTAEIVERLSTRYGLDHVTVQVSPVPGRRKRRRPEARGPPYPDERPRRAMKIPIAAPRRPNTASASQTLPVAPPMMPPRTRPTAIQRPGPRLALETVFRLLEFGSVMTSSETGPGLRRHNTKRDAWEAPGPPISASQG